MLDFYLEGKLPQATYEAKQEQIVNQRAELEQTAEKYKNIDADMKKRVVQVMALANNISKLFDMELRPEETSYYNYLFQIANLMVQNWNIP